MNFDDTDGDSTSKAEVTSDSKMATLVSVIDKLCLATHLSSQTRAPWNEVRQRLMDLELQGAQMPKRGLAKGK